MTNPKTWQYTPVIGKRPFLEDWPNNPHTFDEINYPTYGYGLILGPSSGGVVAIDFDGPLAWEYFSDELNLDIDVDDPICWTSWKQGRCQMAFLVPEVYWEHLHTTKIDLGDKQGLEFRWTGGQSVLPPSDHPDTGGQYEWINEPNDTNSKYIIPDDVLKFWLEHCNKRNQQSQPQPQTEHIPVTTDELKQVLEFLKANYPRFSHDLWTKVTWAVIHEAGKLEGLMIMKGYWPEEKKGEYENLAKSYKAEKSPTFGTLVHLAKQKDPKFTIEKPVEIEVEEERITEGEDVNLTANYISASCGEGKTYQMLDDIAKTGGVWIYAVDKISPTISERRMEFSEACTRHNVEFEVRDAHSKKEEEWSVGKQIGIIRSEISSRSMNNVIVFVTHKALFLFNWKLWTDANCVLDEAADIYLVGTNDFRENYELVQQHFEKAENDGDCYILIPSDEGLTKLKANQPDDITKEFYGLLKAANLENGRLWVKAEQWDNANDNLIEYFTILEPRLFLNFKNVWVLGDELEKSMLFNVWTDRYKVNWVKKHINKPRQRIMPTNDRLTVFYFDKHRDASFKRFQDTSEGPLTNIADYFTANYPQFNDYIWTTNSRYEKRLSEVLLGKHILPKAQGRNDLKHYNVCLWLAAMKSSFIECAMLKQICGVSKGELDLSKEYNALYQFIMRTSLRDFESTNKVEVYVYSKLQAEYLIERLGGTMKHIEGVVKEKPLTKGGRPRKSTDALTAKQRARKSWLIKSKGHSETEALKMVLTAEKSNETPKSWNVLDALIEVDRYRGALQEDRYQEMLRGKSPNPRNPG